MYIKELDSICDSLQNQDNNQSEIRKIVNLFRIGLREDYWGSLSISDLDQVLSRIGKTRHELRKIDEKGETSERATAFDMILGQDEALREHTVSKLIGSPPGYVGYTTLKCNCRRAVHSQFAALFI